MSFVSTVKLIFVKRYYIKEYCFDSSVAFQHNLHPVIRAIQNALHV